MNINRLRPTGVKKEDLDLWLSSVINDACRDAIEAGMPQRDVHFIMKSLTDSYHPLGKMGVEHDKRKMCRELAKEDQK